MSKINVGGAKHCFMCIYVDGIIAVTLVKVIDDFSFGDLGKHNKIVDTLLREATLALELCNLLCGVPLPLLEACTHFSVIFIVM